MTPEYLLEKFIAQGGELRTAQKAFFATTDPLSKKIALAASKKAEKEFDNLLFNAKQLFPVKK